MFIKNNKLNFVLLAFILLGSVYAAATEAIVQTVIVTKWKKELEDVKAKHLNDVEIALKQSADLRCFFDNALADFNVAPKLALDSGDEGIYAMAFNSRAKLDYLVHQFNKALDGYYNNRSKLRRVATSTGIDKSHHMQCMGCLLDISKTLGVELPVDLRFAYAWIEDDSEVSDVVSPLMKTVSKLQQGDALSKMYEFLEKQKKARSLASRVATGTGARESRTAIWMKHIEEFADLKGIELKKSSSSRKRTPSPPHDSRSLSEQLQEEGDVDTDGSE